MREKPTNTPIIHSVYLFGRVAPTCFSITLRRAVSPLKIKILSKNMREKPKNTPIIYSVYYVGATIHNQ
jgi:DNA polymerase III delta prime subunit